MPRVKYWKQVHFNPFTKKDATAGQHYDLEQLDEGTEDGAERV